MPYVILQQDSHGEWSDYLGPGENLWETEAAASAAIVDLEAVGFIGPWLIRDSGEPPTLELTD